LPIQTVFCNPPLGIARIGGSSVPMDSFAWVAATDPHNAGETRVAPDWTLDVQADGGVVPRMPSRVVLRDAGDLRPVAPFTEIWCEVGPDAQPESWQRMPLTPALLAADGLNVANLTLDFEAKNLKAARRTGNAALRYGTFPPVQIFGDDHTRRRLLAVSPPDAAPGVRMIPADRQIDLGQVQVIRPTLQPPAGSTPWADNVRVDTLRLRFTPARGTFYGPEAVRGATITVNGAAQSLVPAENAFLANGAGWLGAAALQALIAPADTFDGAEQSNGLSLGIVDDTCELRVTVTLDRSPIGRPSLQGHANLFSGPPDYAPDRRPFVSLADELNDRRSAAAVAAANQTLDNASRDRWVEDLFERAFETLSLFNVDLWRNSRSAELAADQRRAEPIRNDRYPQAERAMGALDALRDADIVLDAPSGPVPLPLFARARERHRFLSDILALKRFVQERPERLVELTRRAFSVAANEDANQTTMQMPPFMRNSNAQPLTLVQWQYDLLMAWRQALLDAPSPVAAASRPAAERSQRARERRARVLSTLD
jgi:hypothetical protein